MNVIFLDIDGVLVNRRALADRRAQKLGYRYVADPPCVDALNAITETTQALIVLSSSWRFCGLEEMRLILKHWGVEAPLVDMTPDLTRVPIEDGGLYQGVPRGREIQAWLDAAEHPITSFVILDDDADMEHLAPFLIKTEFEPGLTMEHAERAIAMLRRAPETAPASAEQNPAGGRE